jgi:hypothetical protein
VYDYVFSCGVVDLFIIVMQGVVDCFLSGIYVVLLNLDVEWQ